MAGIQMFDLGPPRVDTFSMISNLGKSFFDAYDAQRRRAAEDRKTKWEDDAAQARSDEVKMWMGGNPSDAPAQPSRAISEVGKLPTFAQGKDLPYASAIKSIESGGKYGIVGPTHPKMGRALGAYQVMEANLPQWSKEALGRAVTPDEFLSNPGIQDQIFNYKFGQYVQKYGNPQDAASVWFSGRPLAGNNSKDVLGTSVPSYVAKFNSAMQRNGGAPAGTQVASAGAGLGYAPDTSSWAVSPRNEPARNATIPNPSFSPQNIPSVNAVIQNPVIPVPFEQAIPGAMQFASLGGVGGAPTMPAPQMAAPAPQAAPVPPPAPPPAPAPVQMAQAAPAVPVASSGDPIRDVFTRLPPGQQALFARYLRNPLTAPAAMQRLQSMVRQNEYSFSNAPDGSLVRTNKATGAVERVPGYEKPQDRWQYQEQPNGDLIGTNAATGKREVLNAGERDAVIRQYQFAQRQGYQGSLFDFKTAMANAARPETTINNNLPKADSKFDETLAADFAKEINETLKDGRNARGDLSRIKQLRAQIEKLPGGFTGGMQALANRYGIKLGPNPDAVEAATAIINQLVPQQRPAGSGTMSDRDVDLFKASLPQLSNTPQGNKIILDTMESLANYRLRQGEIATRVMTKKITREQAIDELNNLPDPFEAFNAATGQAPSLDKIKPGEVLEIAPGVTIRAK